MVSPFKGQCRAALFPLICAWTNGRTANRDAGDLRRHRAHYDVTLLLSKDNPFHKCLHKYVECQAFQTDDLTRGQERVSFLAPEEFTVLSWQVILVKLQIMEPAMHLFCQNIGPVDALWCHGTQSTLIGSEHGLVPECSSSVPDPIQTFCLGLLRTNFGEIKNTKLFASRNTVWKYRYNIMVINIRPQCKGIQLLVHKS